MVLRRKEDRHIGLKDFGRSMPALPCFGMNTTLDTLQDSGIKRDYSKSRSLSSVDSALKSGSLSSRRTSTTSSSSYPSPTFDISHYSPQNYVAGSSRSSAITSSRPSRTTYSSLRDSGYVPSPSLRASRYSDQV
ncbi:hypothetical protein J6590_022946 [Homalodisca vitripennis]|nr:hypothetical protein J6590_022946 [Homalodisca vitripennis]